MHIHRSTAGSDWPRLQFDTWRLWDTVQWAAMEPARGRMDFSQLDALVAQKKSHGVSDMVFVFGRVPSWASAKPAAPCVYADPARRDGGCAGPVAHVDDLSSFARAMVQRYCGVIRYWELWNEPDQSSFWAGSLAELVSQSAVLYRVVKDAGNCSINGTNPNVVLSPAPSEIRSGWLYDWLTHGGAAYSDVIAFHGYEFSDAPEVMAYYLRRVRSWMSAVGKGDAELWDTEGSWGSDEAVEPRLRRSWLARAYTIQAASGVNRFIWYAYDNSKFGTLWEAPGGQNQAGDAYEQVRRWLTGARIEPCETRTGTWVCHLTRSGGYEGAIVWNPRAPATIALSARELSTPVQWRDLAGRKHVVSGRTIDVSPQPILVESRDAF